MKLYSKVKTKRQYTFEEAFNLMAKGFVLTREEWDGFHLVFMGNYIIYTKDKKILINPEEIYAKDKNDWIVVVPTKEAFEDSYKKLSAIFELSKELSI